MGFGVRIELNNTLYTVVHEITPLNGIGVAEWFLTGSYSYNAV